MLNNNVLKSGNKTARVNKFQSNLSRGRIAVYCYPRGGERIRPILIPIEHMVP